MVLSFNILELLILYFIKKHLLSVQIPYINMLDKNEKYPEKYYLITLI